MDKETFEKARRLNNTITALEGIEDEFKRTKKLILHGKDWMQNIITRFTLSQKNLIKWYTIC